MKMNSIIDKPHPEALRFLSLSKWRGITAFLLLWLLLNVANLSAQSIPILTWDSFEHYLKPKNDTVYVINFWATWCKPCVEELPNFEKLQSTYTDKKVEVILVSLDFKNSYKSKLLPFVEKNKLQSKIIMLDTQGNNDFIDKVSSTWQGTIPATTFVQGSSSTKRFYEKQFTYEQLENIVKPLIKM